ncbi:MAG: hypothetical protein ACLP9L_18675 [Thermoguttaceae bacterium]
MRRVLSLVALSVVLPACSGCLSTPNLSHPGTEANQQARAELFEPYPENDLGPPVVGARPREYQDPRSSFTVLRDMQQDRVAGSRLGEPILAPCPQSPITQAPIDQPPIVTPPPAIYYPPGMTQP